MLPFVSAALKGRARAVLQAAPLAAYPRPDVIWTSADVERAPYLWALIGPLGRPLVYDCDGTLDLQEQLAPIYMNRPPKAGLRAVVARLQEKVLSSTVTLFSAWSRWAADSLRRSGIDDERIRVLPPGVDLEAWRPRPELRPERADALRLLFVGGDFARKGGRTLLEVFRARLGGRCELDIVTRDAVPPTPGVRVHIAEPNSDALRRLYARADLFVLPTRAEFFGLATVEALATGLPAIVGDVGAAREIVDDGETGWVIEPTAAALASALERALASRERLPAMGRRARSVAEQRFDGTRNDSLIVEMLCRLAAKERSR
jgi:glycosyltransferase involved in cell wall biosynthesis